MRIYVGDMNYASTINIMFSTSESIVIYDLKKTSNEIASIVKKPIGNLVGSSFFDIDDMGCFSILYETKEPSSVHQLKGFIFIPQGSDYFLKATTFQKTLGQPRVGISYQYVYTNEDGKAKLQAGHQIARNAHRALDMPYYIGGLQKSPGYVEQFYVQYFHNVNIRLII